MPRNGAGTYSLPDGYLAVTGQTILASQHNPSLEDLATAMTGSLPRNGSAGMQTDLPMGGFKIIGMADGVSPTDAATVGQSSTAAATAITTAPLKAAPVDADTIPLVDSAAGNIMKRLTWANLKALFQPVNAALTALGGIGTPASGDIIYSSAAGVWARKAKGTDGQVLTLASGLPVWASGGIFTKSYESAQQTITSSGALTLAHGLGVRPKLYLAFIQCVTAELGYSIGHELPAAVSGSSVQNEIIGLVPDATNMHFRFGNSTSVFQTVNFSTGAHAALTNANWKLVVRAWA